MRKIEQQMINAIHNQKDWHCGNTRVEVRPEACDVRLHGHLIASVYNRDNPTLYRCIVFDHCGYSTATTRSRLNAVASLCREYVGFNLIQRSMHYRKGSPDAKPQVMEYLIRVAL